MLSGDDGGHKPTGDHACDAACPLAAAVAPARIPLGEALGRFARESSPQVCDTGRYHCAYFTWGDGPPLLLIPGLGHDARSFVLLAAHLAREFRCIAYDLPTGAGDGASLARYTHADLVADALALLDHLGMPRSYVLGASFGATVALAAARQCPQRFPRVILQGGFARRPLAPAERLMARLARYWPGSPASMPGRAALLRRCHYAPFADLPPEVWDYFVERSNAQPIRAVTQRALLLHRLDLRPWLADVRQPVLLVYGDRDPLVGAEHAEELLRGLPNAARVEVADCGHNPLFTHPEILAQVVRQFLSPAGAAPI